MRRGTCSCGGSHWFGVLREMNSPDREALAEVPKLFDAAIAMLKLRPAVKPAATMLVAGGAPRTWNMVHVFAWTSKYGTSQTKTEYAVMPPPFSAAAVQLTVMDVESMLDTNEEPTRLGTSPKVVTLMDEE